MKKPATPEELRTMRNFAKALTDQAEVHRREGAALIVDHASLKEALREAVKLLRHLRDTRAGWTPANTKELEEWETLCR